MLERDFRRNSYKARRRKLRKRLKGGSRRKYWDWNKYKQELKNNPEKAKAQFKYLEAMYKMQGGQDNLSKLAPDEEIVTTRKIVKKKSTNSDD